MTSASKKRATGRDKDLADRRLLDSEGGEEE